METNFFWKGDEFSYLNQITVLSHLKVGHVPIIWLSGDKPKSKYWTDNVETRNADLIYDINNFILKGGNFRTAASLWRFNFLYQYGGLYCDTDAFAVKHFPNDDWIVASGENVKKLSTGVLKCPPNHPLWLECIEKIKYKWGNVNVFNNIYLKYFNNNDSTHPNEQFYPFIWNDCEKLLADMSIPDCYSVHLYEYALKNKFAVEFNEEWVKNNPNTLLAKLAKFVG